MLEPAISLSYESKGKPSNTWTVLGPSGFSISTEENHLDLITKSFRASISCEINYDSTLSSSGSISFDGEDRDFLQFP